MKFTYKKQRKVENMELRGVFSRNTNLKLSFNISPYFNAFYTTYLSIQVYNFYCLFSNNVLFPITFYILWVEGSLLEENRQE